MCWIGGRRVIEGVEDRVWWIGSKIGLFSIKSLYKALEQRTLSSFPWKCIWKTCVQQKISFFVWEATWGKILTCDHLQKRGLSLASCCPLCLESEESVDHLLLHCSKTRVLWDLLFSLFGVSWILAATVKDFLLRWKGTFLPKEK